MSVAEQKVRSLSSRGQLVGQQRESDSLVIDIFNLDPIIQHVQEKGTKGEELKLFHKNRPKGARPLAPSDRSPRFKTKVSSNSFVALSHD